MLADKKTTTWIVVTDGSKATIFTSHDNSHELELYKSLESEDARAHSGDLGSEKSHGVTERNRPGSRVDLNAKEKFNFATNLADMLNQAAFHNHYHQLILIASPKFLGDLRELINKQTAALILKEINKDLTKHSKEELKAQIWG
jgi:protein required for attachment to host cells